MGLLQDIRVAARTLYKSRGFTLLVTLTLALGIGANTAVLSIARAIFVRATYPGGDRLMFLSRGYPGFPEGGGNFTNPAYRDILQQSTSFDSIAAFQSFGALALTDGADPIRVNIDYVTPNYLDLLHAPMSQGRSFRAAEDRAGDADAVVVLSYGFWQRAYAGQPIVGRVIHLNRQAFTVIGVTAGGFRDAPAEIDGGGEVDAWLPLGVAYRMTGYSSPTDRASALLWGVGRLKPGVTRQAAAAEFASIGKHISEQYPATDAGYTLVAMPLQDRLVGEFYKPLWLLLGASACILLICCANVANLLLARLVRRQRELAVRSALGASAARIVREILAENFVLVAISTSLAVLLAVWGLDALAGWGNVHLPSVVHVGVDLRTMIDCLLVSAVTIALFGVGPAIAGSRVQLRDAISEGGRHGDGLRYRGALRLLVVSEVTLAIVLLVGTGLLLKSFRGLTNMDLGFNTHKLLTLRVDLNSNRYDDAAARVQFAREVVDKLNAVPGVQAANVMGPGMPGANTWVIEAVSEGKDANDPRNIVMSGRYSVNPGALSSLGIRLLRGRDFTAQDKADTPLVAIVSESTARTEWPGQDPLGKRFRSTGRNEWITVIGLAKDVVLQRRLDLSDAAIGIAPGGLRPQRDVYVPYAQRANRSVVLAVRIQADAESVTKAVRAAILQIDPTLPAYDISMLDDRLAAQDQSSFAITAVTATYATLAMALASLGLFGLLAHAVSRRTHELGVRIAVGATPRHLLVLVIGEGVRLTSLGIVAGIAAAALLTRGMASILFGVSTADPVVYFAVPLMLLAVAAAACYLPARHAMRLDPIVALRHE